MYNFINSSSTNEQYMMRLPLLTLMTFDDAASLDFSNRF